MIELLVCGVGFKRFKIKEYLCGQNRQKMDHKKDDKLSALSPKKLKELHRENKKFLARLQLKRPKDLDDKFLAAHEEVFEETDCLECANCCKTTSPIFKDKDINRIARSLRMKSGKFIEQYLVRDDDYDYVLKTAPCAFLSEDNSCSIYDVRPTACQEYPHTDRKKVYQLMPLTAENSQVCPAVLRIVEKVKSAYQS